MRIGFSVAAAAIICTAWFGALPARGDEQAETETAVWNHGVELYRAGDVTNALPIMKSLLYSRRYGSRAAEVVAALAAARGDIEDAAAAAQLALRAAPDDARLNRNFTRATEGLAEARKTRHIDEVLKAAAGRDLGSIVREATYDARAVMTESVANATNPPVRRVSAADALAARAERIADAFVSAREAIVNSVTNEEQAAAILSVVSSAEDKARSAARLLSDLDPAAYSAMGEAEMDLTGFLKSVALPPLALAEDLSAQSNACRDVAGFAGRDEQREALDYTRAFRAKFPAWAKAYEAEAAADTNREPFTAETQAKISALSTELEKLQIASAEKPEAAARERALALVREIETLMPKDRSSKSGDSSSRAESGKNDNSSSQENGRPDEKETKEDEAQGDERQSEEIDEQPPESAEEQGADSEEVKDEEVESVIRSAQERNDEHEADKRARARKVPLPPNERDW